MEKQKNNLYLVKDFDFKNVALINDKDEIVVIPSKKVIDKNTDFSVIIKKK